MSGPLVLSPLGHTWIFDLDGTLVKHNGYKTDGEDTFLPGAEDFLKKIPLEDMVVIITSRTDECRDGTLKFLRHHGVRYDYIIFNAPYGERILVNDDKPSGLCMSHAVRVNRDEGIGIRLLINEPDGSYWSSTETMKAYGTGR